MDLLEAKDAALSYLKNSNAEVMKRFRTNIMVETKSDQSPVTIADRLGEHTGQVTKAFSNCTPALVKRSRVGVRIIFSS